MLYETQKVKTRDPSYKKITRKYDFRLENTNRAGPSLRRVRQLTKKQTDKLQIRSKRLTTKQLQIKTLKIITFLSTLCSSLQSPLFSLLSASL